VPPLPSPDMPPRILPRKRFGDGADRPSPGALPACAGVDGAAPLAIAPSRCNRCGACLRLGCGAISDPGGEALVIDASACAGGGLCAPLCRGRAIAQVTGVPPPRRRPPRPSTPTRIDSG
jgi:NAD-dependent dihydropyrimidine dehydrogenase PreA subunit